jgi:uncharacterized protein (DUF3820 family)
MHNDYNRSFDTGTGPRSLITRRVVARIPEEKLSWWPHEKSMTMGQLGMHMAAISSTIAMALESPFQAQRVPAW